MEDTQRIEKTGIQTGKQDKVQEEIPKEIQKDGNPEKAEKGWKRTAGWILNLYVLCMLCVFPLYVHEEYFDILTARFDFFWKGTLGTGVLLLLVRVVYLFIEKTKKGREGGSASSKKWDLKKLRAGLMASDYAFTAFVLILLLSMALSGYPYETWWGNRGRYQGVLLWLMFFLSYWMVTRLYRFRRWHLDMGLLAGVLVCLWGISDFFRMNLFGFHTGVDETYDVIFVSCIGNINTYTNYTSLLFGATAALFMLEKERLRIVFYFLVMLVTDLACIMGKSDNVLLAYAAVFSLLPFFVWKNRQGFGRYLLLVATTLLLMWGTGKLVLNPDIRTIADDVNNSGVLIEVGKHAFVLYGAVLIGVLSIGCILSEKLNGRENTSIWKRIRRAWAIILILGAAVVIFAFVDANSQRHPALWERFENLLIFTDQWGSGRGANWRLSMEYYLKEMDLRQKLLGYGPDTYYLFMMDNYMEIMKDLGYGMFDSAHNEYLEYLTTTGILGLVAYLWLIGSIIKEEIRTWKNKMENNSVSISTAALLIAAAAYLMQAAVNIAVPITSPSFMMILFLGCNIFWDCRKKNNL